MSIKSHFSMKGIEKYLDKVAQAGVDIDAAASRAVDAGASVIHAGMIKRAPFKTGNLLHHIQKIGPIQDGNFHFSKIGVFNVKRDKNGASYFFYQEMGTVHNPPHPYLRPAFDEDSRAAKKAELESLKKDGAL